MKNFVLLSATESKTPMARFAAFNGDWKQMSIAERVEMLSRILKAVIAIDQDDAAKLQAFVAQGYTSTMLGVFEITKSQHEGCVVFEVAKVLVTPARISDVTAESFDHFVEDCNDELTK